MHVLTAIEGPADVTSVVKLRTVVILGKTTQRSRPSVILLVRPTPDRSARIMKSPTYLATRGAATAHDEQLVDLE
jgi:hypothetical protein